MNICTENITSLFPYSWKIPCKNLCWQSCSSGVQFVVTCSCVEVNISNLFQQCYWTIDSNMADLHWRKCETESRDPIIPPVLWGCWYLCRTLGVGFKGHEDRRWEADKHHIVHVSACSGVPGRVISTVCCISLLSQNSLYLMFQAIWHVMLCHWCKQFLIF